MSCALPRSSGRIARVEQAASGVDRLPVEVDDPVPGVAAPDAAGILAVSSAAGTGLDEVKEYLWKFVEGAKSEEAPVEAWQQEHDE